VTDKNMNTMRLCKEDNEDGTGMKFTEMGRQEEQINLYYLCVMASLQPR
jgi:hypothetical protein